LGRIRGDDARLPAASGLRSSRAAEGEGAAAAPGVDASPRLTDPARGADGAPLERREFDVAGPVPAVWEEG
jgi:hypothetical protein